MAARSIAMVAYCRRPQVATPRAGGGSGLPHPGKISGWLSLSGLAGESSGPRCGMANLWFVSRFAGVAMPRLSAEPTLTTAEEQVLSRWCARIGRQGSWRSVPG
jgi:hypothetical protein